MSSRESVEPQGPLFPEIDDPTVTDEQLGMIVRAYKGVARPPQVIVVRSTGWEKALAVALLLACLVFGSGFWVISNTQEFQLQRGSDTRHILCDKGRIGGVDSEPDARTKEICARENP
jgi:hypothetical protein